MGKRRLGRDLRRPEGFSQKNLIGSVSIGNLALTTVPEFRVWMDLWCGSLSLSISFPTLFDVVVNKHRIVASVVLDGRKWLMEY